MPIDNYLPNNILIRRIRGEYIQKECCDLENCLYKSGVDIGEVPILEDFYDFSQKQAAELIKPTYFKLEVFENLKYEKHIGLLHF